MEQFATALGAVLACIIVLALTVAIVVVLMKFVMWVIGK